MPRVAKPTKLRALEGNREHRPMPKDEPLPDPTLPNPPDWLDPVGLARWNELAPELNEIGILTRIDGDVLAVYCASYAEMVKYTAYIKKHGSTFTTDSGYVQQVPQVGMLNKARENLRKFGSELAIGAASRTKVSVKTPQKGANALESVRAQTAR